ncbi:MAG: cytidylyltransferase domain-containing protein [Arenicella sp.]
MGLNGKKVVAIIEARMNSTRLPGKVLKPLSGVPVIGQIVNRLRAAKHVDEVCVATVNDSSCDALVDYCEEIGATVFRGSEDDVLDRVLKAAYFTDADVIVEICGDCPLIDAGVVDAVVQQYFQEGVDFCSNAIQRVHPIGLDVKVFSTAVLQQVADKTDDPYDHEHVSLYIYEHPELFSISHLSDQLSADQVDYRLTLDTQEDFRLINAVYQHLFDENKLFTLTDVLTLLSASPELLSINQGIKQKGVRE